MATWESNLVRWESSSATLLQAQVACRLYIDALPTRLSLLPLATSAAYNANPLITTHPESTAAYESNSGSSASSLAK